ncbi:TPA: chromosome partitioning protein ParA [Photobacterium damselae]
MKFNKTLIATSLLAALTLSGCGSDSNDSVTTKPTTPETENIAKGRFIDAQVQGLDFISGAEKGQTDSDGNYTIDPDASAVSFYLGGENGLLIGSVSSRSVTTPFEAAGTYERSINLARLLLTINDHNDNSTIIIPTEIKDNPSQEIKAALAQITLDDTSFEKSVNTLLTLLDSKKLVSAVDAEQHMQASLNPTKLKRGSEKVLSQWAKGSDQRFVERSTVLRIKNPKDENPKDEYHNAIHADRTLGEEVFTKTVGLSSMQFTLKKDEFLVHKGSNDTTFSDRFAAQYLTCVKENGEISVDSNNGDAPLCNGIPIEPDQNVDFFNEPSAFTYVITNPLAEQDADESMSWDEFADEQGVYGCMSQQNCSEEVLTQFAEFEVDDSDAEDGSSMQREMISGSYDPITGVYVQSRTKEKTTGIHTGRTTEYISFIYPINADGSDRYVDFKGTWTAKETRPDCANVAVSKMVFNDKGLILTGNEFKPTPENKCNTITIQDTQLTPYSELAKMDFWWFGTNETGVSLATLDQLNTTVRWNDKKLNEIKNNFKINRFSYIPAGKNWDLGLLVRDTLNNAGQKSATITIQKISN